MEELRKVNGSNTLTSDFRFDVADHPSLWPFAKFCNDITQVIRKELPPTTFQTVSTVTPPTQTTVPRDPQYSSPSTASTSSRESKAELLVQTAANDFLWGTLQAIEKPLEKHAWYYDGGYRLESTYMPPEYC